MGVQFSVEYDVRDKSLTIEEYIKEYFVERFLEDFSEYLEDPENSDYYYFDKETLEQKDSYAEVAKTMDREILMSTSEWDDLIIEKFDRSEQFFYYIFDTLEAKYDVLRRYLIAFKIALSKIRPHKKLTEEGDPKVLDQYLKWMEDVYKEINQGKNPPQLSEEVIEDLNNSFVGLMGRGHKRDLYGISNDEEFAFSGSYSYGRSSHDFEIYEHPSGRFEFHPNNEESFKIKIKDILLNKNIFYRYDWY
jgi:hypothetical protein